MMSTTYFQMGGEAERERERNTVITVESKGRVRGGSLGYFLNFLVCWKTFMVSCRKHKSSCLFICLGLRRGSSVLGLTSPRRCVALRPTLSWELFSQKVCKSVVLAHSRCSANTT